VVTFGRRLRRRSSGSIAGVAAAAGAACGVAGAGVAGAAVGAAAAGAVGALGAEGGLGTDAGVDGSARAREIPPTAMHASAPTTKRMIVPYC